MQEEHYLLQITLNLLTMAIYRTIPREALTNIWYLVYN